MNICSEKKCAIKTYSQENLTYKPLKDNPNFKLSTYLTTQFGTLTVLLCAVSCKYIIELFKNWYENTQIQHENNRIIVLLQMELIMFQGEKNLKNFIEHLEQPK